MKKILSIVLATFILCGCTSAREIGGNSLQVYGLFGSPSPLHWEREMARRYPRGAVLVTCHGLEDFAVWMCQPEEGPPRTVIGLIAEVRAKFPHDRIVLVICNPNGHSLPANIRNVSYPLTNLWQYPDRVSGLRFDEGFGVNYIGSIYEFHEQ